MGLASALGARSRKAIPPTGDAASADTISLARSITSLQTDPDPGIGIESGSESAGASITVGAQGVDARASLADLPGRAGRTELRRLIDPEDRIAPDHD